MLTGEVPFKGENQVAVAMKHVREELPDVQTKCPDVSAALAAVVDTATAKRVEDRYADDAELIADLEDVLAIETARSGSATGEVTSVLRTLPSQAQRRVPFGVRHRVWAVLLVLLVLALVGGGIAWLATRTHHNAPKLAAPPADATWSKSRSAHTAPTTTTPMPSPEPRTRIPASTGSRSTVTGTPPGRPEHYYDEKLGKPGVGLYVDALKPVQAQKIVIYTQSKGFGVQIWATNSPPDPDVFTTGPGGWVKLAQLPSVLGTEPVPITVPKTGYRYYLVWITALPPGKTIAYLNEIALYELTR